MYLFIYEGMGMMEGHTLSEAQAEFRDKFWEFYKVCCNDKHLSLVQPWLTRSSLLTTFHNIFLFRQIGVFGQQLKW